MSKMDELMEDRVLEEMAREYEITIEEMKKQLNMMEDYEIDMLHDGFVVYNDISDDEEDDISDEGKEDLPDEN